MTGREEGRAPVGGGGRRAMGTRAPCDPAGRQRGRGWFRDAHYVFPLSPFFFSPGMGEFSPPVPTSPHVLTGEQPAWQSRKSSVK